EYEIKPGLKLRSSLGATYAVNGGESFLPTHLFASSGIGNSSQSTDRAYNWLNENTLNYDHEFNKIHSINTTAGFTFQHWYDKSYSAGVSNLSTNALGYNNFGVGIATPPASYFGDNSLASYFGRVNYRLMGKYLLTLTMRADGSSR